MTVSGDWTRLDALQKRLFFPEPRWQKPAASLPVGVIAKELRGFDWEAPGAALSKVYWVIADVSSTPTREALARIKDLAPALPGKHPRLWLEYGDLNEERIRSTLYQVRASGPGRHLIDGLALSSRSQLPIKRSVAEYWVDVCAWLAAGKGSLPFLSSSQDGAAHESEFWRRACRRTLLACYGLAHEEPLEGEVLTPRGSVSVTEMVSLVQTAGLGLAKARAFRSALRRSPKLVLKSVPWITGAVTAATLVASGRKAYQDCRSYGLSLVDELEDRWRHTLEASDGES